MVVCAAEYDVNQDGTGDFAVIQDAIDAAVHGDVIVVHPGTYCENIHFRGKNITLRSLDPENEDIVASTVIEALDRRRRSVVTFDGTEDETCLLSGFTITNGQTFGFAQGGGILGGGPWSDEHLRTLAGIRNCTIKGNSATGPYGGGGGLSWCGGPISSCTITGNSAENWGGGVYQCSGTIADCMISDNSAGWRGGGLCNCYGTISNCIISQNAVTHEYGHGGGLAGCSGEISNCTITDNWADDGGGLLYCHGLISNCTISHNSATGEHGEGGGFSWCQGTISSCAITDNSAWLGGGLFSCCGPIANCTITGNEASSGGGIYLGYFIDWHCVVLNSVMWGDTPDEIAGYTALATVTYSDVDGGWTGTGNISNDPLLVSGPLGDYYLSCTAAGQEADSPCIDAGSGTAESLGLDKLTTRTDSAADSGIVDMGYHYPLAIDQNPQINCSINASEFTPGDELVGFVEAHNPGPDISVDAYVAFILPDGAIFSFTGGGLVLGIYPWIAEVILPGGFEFGPSGVFRTTVPESPGDYAFAAVFTVPGSFEFIGDPSLFSFVITD